MVFVSAAATSLHFYGVQVRGHHLATVLAISRFEGDVGPFKLPV